jgi:hypothetical protein
MKKPLFRRRFSGGFGVISNLIIVALRFFGIADIFFHIPRFYRDSIRHDNFATNRVIFQYRKVRLSVSPRLIF